jgi:glycosyltransferase involved in cell wall biosynthesis
MSVAAITITYNRLELTKATMESFYSKTSVDYHLFIDNGSTDGTQEFLKNYDRIILDKNYGITEAFCLGVSKLEDYDYILKLDNDVETITEDIVAKMVTFLDIHSNYAVSPVDINLLPNFKPTTIKRFNLSGYNVEVTSHTGGAFQLARSSVVKELCKDKRHFQRGDYMIGHWYRRHNINPAYLLDLQMRHIGLNQSTPTDRYIL